MYPTLACLLQRRSSAPLASPARLYRRDRGARPRRRPDVRAAALRGGGRAVSRLAAAITVERPRTGPSPLFQPELPSRAGSRPMRSIAMSPAGGGSQGHDELRQRAERRLAAADADQTTDPGGELKRFARSGKRDTRAGGGPGASRQVAQAGGRRSTASSDRVAVAAISPPRRRRIALRHCLGFARSVRASRGCRSPAGTARAMTRSSTAALVTLRARPAGGDRGRQRSDDWCRLFAQAELKREFCRRKPPRDAAPRSSATDVARRCQGPEAARRASRRA